MDHFDKTCRAEQATLIKIGRIVNVVGLKGEIKVYNYSDSDQRYQPGKQVFTEKQGKTIDYTIERARTQKGMIILKLAGIDDRTAAEAMKTQDLYIRAEVLESLPEDTYYVRDLIGCRVIEEGAGKCIGIVQDVLQNTAQDLYQIRLLHGGEGLIPAVGDFVKAVDVKKREIRVRLIPGLLDLGDGEEGIEM